MTDDQPSALALSWSGGKDSALALWVLRREHGIVPRALITTVTDAYDRVSMHGVRRSLLARQASVIGVPLVEIEIPVGCTNDVYDERMTQALASEPLRSVEAVAFGDLFLEDIRSYREDRLATVGKSEMLSALAPGHHKSRARVHRRRLRSHHRVPRSRQARPVRSRGAGSTTGLLADLPGGVDPCGENGEFHTFVSAGPIMSAPIDVQVGETVERNGFVFSDLTAADAPLTAPTRTRSPG